MKKHVSTTILIYLVKQKLAAGLLSLFDMYCICKYASLQA